MELLERARQILDGKGDVMQPGSSLVILEKLLEPRISPPRSDQLDGAAGGFGCEQKGGFGLLRLDEFARALAQPQELKPTSDLLIEAGDANGYVIDSRDAHSSSYRRSQSPSS
jgi:hypothetical protein